MKKNKELIDLIKKCGGKEKEFKNLTIPAQCSIGHYMSVDGEAWSQPLEFTMKLHLVHLRKNTGELVKKNINFYAKKYGKKKFGTVDIPTNDFLNLFVGLKNRYNNRKIRVKRKEIWPVILDLDDWDRNTDDVAIIQDGWHRFGDYVAMGIKKIPCVYYLENEKYY